MSRIAKAPVVLPAGVELNFNAGEVVVKGSKGTLTQKINLAVNIEQSEGSVTFAPVEGAANGWAHAGTVRSLVNNMVEIGRAHV